MGKVKYYIKEICSIKSGGDESFPCEWARVEMIVENSRTKNIEKVNRYFSIQSWIDAKKAGYYLN